MILLRLSTKVPVAASRLSPDKTGGGQLTF